MNTFSIYGDQVDTFESFFRNVLCAKDRIIIPYVGLGLIEHELNPSKSTIKYIDRCYVILDGVVHLDIYNKPNLIQKQIPNSKKTQTVFLGGQNLDNDQWIDINVICADAHIIAPLDYRISENLWIPLPTPNLPQNIDTRMVEELYSFHLAPEEIRLLRKTV